MISLLQQGFGLHILSSYVLATSSPVNMDVASSSEIYFIIEEARQWVAAFLKMHAFSPSVWAGTNQNRNKKAHHQKGRLSQFFVHF